MIAFFSRLGFTRNVNIIIACQALGMTSTTMTMTVAALAGQILAPSPAYATLPIAFQFLATLLGTIPAAFLNRSLGRRLGGLIGISLGLVGGAVAFVGLLEQSFIIFTTGCFLYGLHNAFIQQYRFAAAEAATPEARNRVVSYVMLGGIFAAIVGPTLAIQTRELFPTADYAGAYLGIAALSIMAAIVMAFVDPAGFNQTTPGETDEPARPLTEILSQRSTIVAVLAAAVGYGAMNFVMVATPLSMKAVGCTPEQTGLVLTAHILGMFVPSFFTGSLINRIKVGRVILLGVIAIAGCIIINMLGDSMTHFLSALILLGVGWNFMFVGGTALLTASYRPSERAKVQAVNDFLVFGLVAITAMLSGAVFATGGWAIVNIVVIPFLFIVLGVYGWVAISELLKQRRLS